ncbi:MAG: sulfur carrier protein ThiS [Planctomycetota bacterium]|jgi:thiamine biosynthesis protein ThiS|nr:sulfur carrier protein ThiS [Planctomycetota bacterium]
MNDSTAVFEVRLNGESHSVQPGTTVATLIEELAIESSAVAVERNRKIVPRSLHPSTAIEAGDELEVVTIVGGG